MGGAVWRYLEFPNNLIAILSRILSFYLFGEDSKLTSCASRHDFRCVPHERRRRLVVNNGLIISILWRLETSFKPIHWKSDNFDTLGTSCLIRENRLENLHRTLSKSVENGTSVGQLILVDNSAENSFILFECDVGWLYSTQLHTVVEYYLHRICIIYFHILAIWILLH